MTPPPLTGPVPAVLLAGALHAVWNALAKAVPDRYVAMAMMAVAQAGAGCLMVFVVAPPGRDAWPWLAASVPLQGTYMILLARAYGIGDFGQVYPLARGTAPLVVALVAMITLGESLSVWRTAGLVAVCGGLGVLALSGGRVGTGAVVATLMTGITIAAYTLVDGIGVRRSGSPLGYAAWGFAIQGPLVAGTVLAMRGRTILEGIRASWRSGITGGLISVIAYTIVLWAQTRGALAAVSALRETGVIVGVAIGWICFAEPLGRRRLAAAGAVVVGIVLLS
jgi:drug/metabolite transporter (DMT)-like permease